MLSIYKTEWCIGITSPLSVGVCLSSNLNLLVCFVRQLVFSAEHFCLCINFNITCVLQMLIQRRPRKGTKKFRPRPLSGSKDRDRDRDRRSPILSRMGDFSDSDDSDISSVSQSRRLHRRMRSPKQSLKTVIFQMLSWTFELQNK